MTKKIMATILVALCLAGYLYPAGAQETASVGYESVTTIATSVSASTSLVAAVTGRKLVIKALHLNGDTAGTYAFTDGDGGTTLLNVYLPANTDVQINDKILADCVKTTAATALYVDGPSSAVLRCNIRTRRE